MKTWIAFISRQHAFLYVLNASKPGNNKERLIINIKSLKLEIITFLLIFTFQITCILSACVRRSNFDSLMLHEVCILHCQHASWGYLSVASVLPWDNLPLLLTACSVLWADQLQSLVEQSFQVFSSCILLPLFCFSLFSSQACICQCQSILHRTADHTWMSIYSLLVQFWQNILDTLDYTVHGAADLNRTQMSHVDCNDAESCLGYGHQLRDDDAQKCLECSKDGCAGILAGGADDDPWLTSCVVMWGYTGEGGDRI